ncbi:copper resistance protein NlpE [Rufibacter sp. LB8]|uniref:copper resistance protein NlpE n=2 Tax=Rufibacter sp. LB8 TaxID=2777781 RepID=UPI00178C4A1E|nr:copper resistance protein NlpE [Rufibacter sp. LB8]
MTTFGAMKYFCFFLVCAVVLGACQQRESAKTDQTAAQIGQATQNFEYAGTFVGTVPCEDCEGIHMQLVLQPNHTYQLEEGFIKEQVYPVKTSGRWLEIENGEKVLLQPAQADEVRYLEVKDENTLVLLVPEKEQVENKLDYGLSRVDPETGETAEEEELAN